MLKPKQRLGEFEIIRILGKGGMGEVYEAQQSNPNRRVALKVLKPWLADDDNALDRFKREAEVPAQLDHPGVVRIFATGKSEGHVYYAMQLVRGISLQQLVRKVAEPLPETIAQPGGDTSESEASRQAVSDDAVTEDLPSPDQLPSVVHEYRKDRYVTLARIGMHAARALDSAHRHGVLHRDIKPSNIMIDHHDQLYLVDFGLTKALDSATGTRTGVVIGTPWYMSPEQARGLPLDGRSDIYSLGVTLYQLATGGKGPYLANRDDTDAILREVRSGTLQPLSTLAPEIPPALASIINRAVNADPVNRYQSAGELAKDLEAFLQSGSGPRPLKHAGSRRRVATAAAAVVMLGAAATIAAVVMINRGPEKGAGDPPPVAPRTNPADPFERSRPLATAIHLLRQDHQPVAHRILSGQGKMQALATELVVQADGNKPFVVALDDPKKGNYDFKLNISPRFQPAPFVNDVGVFFGWRDQIADPQMVMRFFAIKLDKRPVLNDIHGRLYIGTWQLHDRPGPVGGVNEVDPRPFLRTSGFLSLGPLDKQAHGWHQLQVAVREPKVTITVDNEPAHVFDANEVKRKDKTLSTQDLDTAGMVGVWVRQGVASFRDIVIIPR